MTKKLMTNLICTIFISISFIYISPVNSLDLPRVTVDQGEIVGTDYVTIDNRVIHAFYGVPYASAPVLKYRFKPPQPLKPWTGFWNASKYASSCLQYSHAYTIVGEEDCLYLNIFTPELPINGVSKLMDVVVYIHGGAFMFGAGSSFYPDHLLKHGDVVLVTLNYRLGPLGFFSTGDEIIPGNNGLKDQVAALKWIHSNIIKFGGNPSSVTISGMSAGGASVHYHYLSTLSQGLFQRGISFSGSIFAIWTLPKNVPENSAKLASLLGCAYNSTKDNVKCLQRRPARQIVEMVPLFMTWRYCPFTVFGPVVEPASDFAFLSEDPLDLLLNGKIANLPWLATTCKEEGLYPVADFIYSDEYLNHLNNEWYNIAPYLLHYNYLPSEVSRDISSKIKSFYFGQNEITKDVIKEIIQVAGDRLFYLPIQRALKLHASVSNMPVYCYKFNYRGKYSLSNKYSNSSDDYGVSHGDDLQYVIKVSYHEVAESDRDMINFLTPALLSFIRTGKIDNKWSHWKPISGIDVPGLQCLEINSAIDTKLVDTYDSVTEEFWNSILPERYLEAKTSPPSRTEL